MIDEEPRFELRAQDLFAPYAVEEYAQMLRAAAAGMRAGVEPLTKGATADRIRELHGPSNVLLGQANEASRIASQMIGWQAGNSSRVKLPD